MKETMETLILPEPARTTWCAARDVIRDLFTDENNGDGYELSGSCVLAARWEHRQDDEVTVVTADPRGILTPDNKMEKRLEHSLAAKVTRWRASRGARLKTTDGWIVITARRGNRPDRSDSAMVDGVRENVSGTTRILQMILAENEEIAGRDAFDIVTARTSASRELEEALRDYGPRQIQMLARSYRTMNEFLTVDARRRILGPEATIPLANIGLRAAEVLEQIATGCQPASRR